MVDHKNEKQNRNQLVILELKAKISEITKPDMNIKHKNYYAYSKASDL